MTKEGYLKHKELIEAWANGAKIEYYDETIKVWKEIEDPGWFLDTKYRIKSSKYELEGGDWYLDGEFNVVKAQPGTESAYLGLERKTKEKAEDLSKLLKRTARLHALVCELGGLKKFEPFDNNYYVYKDVSGKHKIASTSLSYFFSHVYMTRECAEKISKMLNNEEFDLEGEKNE